MDVRVVLVMMAVAVAAAIRWRRRPPSDQPGSGPPTSVSGRRTPDPAPPSRRAATTVGTGSDQDEHVDVELQEALDRVWNEHAHDADTMLDARLRQLVDRGVPIRALRPAPGGRAIRVVFGDGTVLLCRGSGQGDFGRLGLALLNQSVRLGGFVRTDSGTRLEFRWHPGHRLAAVAVGLDQPD